MHPVSADARLIRRCHGHGERRRHHGIDGIAAVGQNLHANLFAGWMAHHAPKFIVAGRGGQERTMRTQDSGGCGAGELQEFTAREE